MDNRIVKEYLRIRKDGNSASIVGESAKCDLRSARTRVKWAELEAQGLVRLRAEPDRDYNWNECDPDESEKYGDDGAWGAIGQYLSSDGEWEGADSIWGCVGYVDVLDPDENCYIDDIMAETIRALEAERDIGGASGAD